MSNKVVRGRAREAPNLPASASAATISSSQSPATPRSNASVSACEERLKPSGEKIAAAELIRLVNAYGVDPQRWNRNAPEWIEAIKHVPHDLLNDAISQLIRQARTGDHFPRPGDILALVADQLATRTDYLKHAKEAEEVWPKWLEDVWGPAPKGPQKRAAALRGEPRDDE